jgi:hypothetical protein
MEGWVSWHPVVITIEYTLTQKKPTNSTYKTNVILVFSLVIIFLSETTASVQMQCCRYSQILRTNGYLVKDMQCQS